MKSVDFCITSALYIDISIYVAWEAGILVIVKLTKDEREKRIKELYKKKVRYEGKLASRSKGYGKMNRIGSGDSYSDQLRDDTNVYRGIIKSIDEEIEILNK